ncbi:MAG: hypothetical protein JKY56_01860 [Kofleriaceae bacterium]|nr:hypothetical protein [Kofleriaceae bacterium]
MQIPSGNSIPSGSSIPLQQARAVVSPAAPDAGNSAISSFKFTAGGGLLAGIIAGFVLISGGSEPSQAIAAESDKGPEKVALLGDDTEPVVGDDDSNGVVEENSGETELPENAGGDPTQVAGSETAGSETAGGETPDKGTIETKTVAAPEPTPPDPNATKFFVRFEIRPAILRDRVSILVDGESYDVRSFYTLSLKPGAKSQKIRVSAKVEGYRDFKGSQVIRHDDQFVIQMKEMPASAEPVAKKPVAKKPVTKKPVTKKPVAKKPVAKKPRVSKPKKPRKPRSKPKGPGALISL